MKRKQTEQIISDLNKKMVFITGPRQVGKTWLAKEISSKYKKPVYLNYDSFEDNKIIHNQSWMPETDLLILDEIHKMPDWKNYLKGVWDTKSENLKILVTGSARLETFRQTGDSLAGRFFRLRLLPFSISEINNFPETGLIDRLIRRGGFPEPFLAEKDKDADRWRLQYFDGLIREDIPDFERVQNTRSIKLILELLRRKVGSPISYKGIAEDTNLAPNTVKRYISILEDLYIIFRITPYSKNIARALQKEPKIYFFDSGMVIGDEGKRFENLMAISLLKHIYGLNDMNGDPVELRHLRTKDGLEVDFCLVREEIPYQMIEVKTTEKTPGKAIYKFNEKYDIPAVCVFKNIRQEQMAQGIVYRKAFSFLKELIV